MFNSNPFHLFGMAGFTGTWDGPVREMRDLRTSVRREAADGGLLRCDPLRWEVFGCGDQRLEDLQGRG